MTLPSLHVVVPGSIDQRTGGYLYDARIVTGLRQQGWSVRVNQLDGRFPGWADQARDSFATTLARLPDGAQVVIDGLALGGLPEVASDHCARLSLLALVHLLLADEAGLTSAEHRRYLELEPQALAACDGVLVTSAFTGARVADLGIESSHVRVVLPGTDPARPATGPGLGEPPRLLCLASVTPRKGQDVLVRALETLVDLRWNCVCAGSLTRSPVFVDALQRHVRAAGLANRIVFTGECDEETVDGLYDASSIFVLPSYFEGYGMVLTEAMARGLPIVTTTGGAIVDTVPPEAGILVPPGDDVALARVLRGLLSSAPDPGPDRADRSRSALAAAARRHASTLPTWEDAVDQFAQAVCALGTVAARTDDRRRGNVQPRLA